MQMKKAIFILTLSMTLSGCNSDQYTDRIKSDFTIGVVTKAKDSEYWMSFISGMERAALDYHVNIVLVSPKAETDAIVQKEMIDEMLEKRIDAIAVSPIDSYETSYLELAEEKGIPLFACDSDFVGQDVVYIGADNYKMGYQMAEHLADYMNGTGQVGIIAGSLQQQGHKARVDGFCDYIDQYTDIEVAFLKAKYSNLLISQKEIAQIIRKNPDIGGIFITNAVTAMGVSDYLSGEGYHLPICAIDIQEDALEALSQGELLALANHSGYQNGYYTVEQIVKAVRDGEETGDYIIETQILTVDNVQEYLDAYQQ